MREGGRNKLIVVDGSVCVCACMCVCVVFQ